MGAKESKVQYLAYNEALERVTSEELKRIRLTFKQKAGSSNYLSKKQFCADVLGELVPKRLADLIFLTCGGTTKGISFQNVVILLVLIATGTTNEKVKFLFTLISVDGLSVTHEDLENFYTACDGSSVYPMSLQNAFLQTNKFLFDEFRNWLLVNTEFSEVTRWLLEEQRCYHSVQLSCHDNTPSFYAALAKWTKLSEEDIVSVEKRYWQMKSTSSNGRFDYETFRSYVTPPFPEQQCKSFFEFFDKNDDDYIDLQEMVFGISTFCRGSTYERLKALFQICDLDNNGVLCEEEQSVMCRTLASLSDETVVTMEGMLPTGNNTDGIHFDDFRGWASQNTLIHEYLLLMSQICHIVFGLKPVLKEEEGCIIRRWIERDELLGLQPTLLYYIISMEWWAKWKEYVNYDLYTQSSTLPLSHPVSSISVEVDGDMETTNKNPISNGHALKLPTIVSPGMIDNSHLLVPVDTRKFMVLTGEGGKLKSDVLLLRGKDFEVVCEPVWKALYSWYGGNIQLPRTVIKEPGSTDATLELYPIQVKLYKHSPPAKNGGFSLNTEGVNNLLAMMFSNNTSNNQTPPSSNVVVPKRTLAYYASFSRRNTTKQIADFIASKLKVHSDDLRLWRMENEKELTLLEDEEKTVMELNLKTGSQLLIEMRNQDLSWPEEMNFLVATRNFRERSCTGLLEKGASGLHNLGNTCFMNSAVQCLSNTRPFTQYFLEKMFLYELNVMNPLGMKGVLARHYGDLVNDLWSGMYRSIAPVKLRLTIGQYAPRFNGFQQHDCQELVSFLLDGLHEDLNRVHDKPYVELKDSDGRPDDEVATEAWQNHVKRNQSIVVDLFQGQLKSQVRCLHCKHVSVRFDPFTFLSLPLPMDNYLHVQIPVFLLCGPPVVKYGLLILNDSTVRQVKSIISELCKVPVENLVIVEISSGRVQNIFSDQDKLLSSLLAYMYAYEVEMPIPLNKPINQSQSGDTHVTQPVKMKSRHLKSKLNFRPNKSNDKIHPARLTENSSLDSTDVLNRTDVLEVPGVVPSSISPSRTISSSSSVECINEIPHLGFVTALSRKMIQSTTYFLSWQKLRPYIFGLPVLIPCSRTTSNYDVYKHAWKHVSRCLTGSHSIDDSGYPFELRAVNKEGTYCSWCPWYRFCRGCLVSCNSSTFDCTITHLAIDWDTTALHLHYQHSLEKSFVDHATVAQSYELLREPVCLDKCLRDFTKEEELGEEETWYCSKCKEHRTIAKKFDIWKLPPILVIHLKRFHMLNNRWVKSNKQVKFPSKNFDPSKYLVKRDKEGSRESSMYEEADTLSITDLSSFDIDDSETSEHTSVSTEECLYDLYAISCHAGMMNGGHYVTYAKNVNGKWYCYNDSSCKEVESSVVDNETPYLLFYEKRNLRVAKYMPDLEGLTPANLTNTDDEFDRQVKKYCSVM